MKISKSVHFLPILTSAEKSITAAANAEKTVEVGWAAMYPSKDIVDNAVNSKDHTTLVAAVKAAGTIKSLLKPESKPTLSKILTYYVLAGKFDAKSVIALIKKGGGEVTLRPLAQAFGEELIEARPEARKFVFSDRLYSNCEFGDGL